MRSRPIIWGLPKATGNTIQASGEATVPPFRQRSGAEVQPRPKPLGLMPSELLTPSPLYSTNVPPYRRYTQSLSCSSSKPIVGLAIFGGDVAGPTRQLQGILFADFHDNGLPDQLEQDLVCMIPSIK